MDAVEVTDARRGRRFSAVVEITYLGGSLPDDARAALTATMRADLAADAPDLSFAVSTAARSVLTVGATLRGTSPVEVIGRLAGALDRALMTTGLFEEFDASGKVLRIAPTEHADRIY